MPPTQTPAPATRLSSHSGPGEPSNRRHFTPDQYAIALAFAKSIPVGRSTKEHLGELQNHIKLDSKVPPSKRLEFDAFEYWRDECQKLGQEKRVLEEKLRQAESHSRRNTIPSNPDYDSNQESEEERQNETRGSSRKRGFIDGNLGNPSLEMNDVYFNPQADDPVYRLNGHVIKLGRSRKRLETMSKSTTNLPEIDELAGFTCQALAILDTTLSDSYLAVRLLKMNDGNKRMLNILKQISDQVILSFLASFEALNELSRTILGREEKGRVLYHMTMFFDKSLDLLSTLSSLQVEHEEMIDNHYLRRKRARVDRVADTEYAANRYLGSTLSSIIYNIGWKVNQTTHSELLEGILFVVLQHTGRLVSMNVFDEHVAASKNPGNITESHDIPAPNLLSKHEMRYVIQILYNALGGRDKKDVFLTVLAAGKKNLADQTRLRGTSTISIPPGNLLAKAKVLLQSTLVKTTLGCDELITLNPPPVPAEAPESVVGEKAGDFHGSNWFLEQVWALIGWDLVV